MSRIHTLNDIKRNESQVGAWPARQGSAMGGDRRTNAENGVIRCM